MLTLNRFVQGLQESKITFKRINKLGTTAIEFRARSGNMVRALFNDSVTDQYIKKTTINAFDGTLQKNFINLETNEPGAVNRRIDMLKTHKGKTTSERGRIFWTKSKSGEAGSAPLEFQTTPEKSSIIDPLKKLIFKVKTKLSPAEY